MAGGCATLFERRTNSPNKYRARSYRWWVSLAGDRSPCVAFPPDVSEVASPDEAISRAPELFRRSMAFEISSDVSQCIESNVPPSFTAPSKRLASYSGIPIPTSAPTTPPTVPPTPTPARAPMIGPAAINGPTPEMASAPIPAKRPNVPPLHHRQLLLSRFPRVL